MSIPKTPSILADAIQLLLDTTQKPTAITIHNDQDNTFHLVTYGAGKPAEIIPLKRNPKPIARKLLQRDSFIAYVLENRIEEHTTIFVDQHQILAEIDPEAHIEHTAAMPLTYAQEYRTLQELTKPRTQKPLWRILSTQLIDNLPSALLAMIQQLKHTDNKESNVEINATGLGKVSASRDVQVSFKAANKPESLDIHLDWTYNGPIFDCIDTTFDIPMRLELSVTDDSQLQFTFHLINIDRIERQARATLAEELTSALTPLPVYHGR